MLYCKLKEKILTLWCIQKIFDSLRKNEQFHGVHCIKNCMEHIYKKKYRCILHNNIQNTSMYFSIPFSQGKKKQKNKTAIRIKICASKLMSIELLASPPPALSFSFFYLEN